MSDPIRVSIAVEKHTHELLKEIQNERKENNNLIKSKRAIISQLVMQAHKREVKK